MSAAAGAVIDTRNGQAARREHILDAERLIRSQMPSQTHAQH